MLAKMLNHLTNVEETAPVIIQYALYLRLQVTQKLCATEKTRASVVFDLKNLFIEKV